MNEPWLREPRDDECAAITEQCLRSKAHWGYDAEFMEQCRDELVVTPAVLAENFALLAEQGGDIVGFAEVSLDGNTCELEKLFIDPEAMGNGIGRLLFDAAVHFARAQKVEAMTITADPDAVPFYKKMGAVQCGEVPSGSIAGRRLPLLALTL